MNLKNIAILLLVFVTQACSTNKKTQLEDKPLVITETRLHDIWVAISINGTPVAKRDEMPRMELNLNTMQIFGNNGCNEFSGKIKAVTQKKITFSNVATTRKMCAAMEVPDSFDKAVQQTASYKHADLNLIFYDRVGKELIRFLKVD